MIDSLIEAILMKILQKKLYYYATKIYYRAINIF